MMGAHHPLLSLHQLIKELGLMEEQWVMGAHQLLLGLLMIKEPGLMEANHHGT